MSSRSALLVIMVTYCSVQTCGAAEVAWENDICPRDIPENTPMGNLSRFQATNAENYTIIAQNVTDRFTIALGTGVLSSAKALDYESDEKAYYVQIMAVNNSSSNANVTCEIRVTDVNDEWPMFVDVAYYVPTENHVAINTSLLTVSATDKDVTAEFNKVVYSIKDGQNGSSFSVDKDTGTIRTKIILANPNPVNLTLTAVATDNNNSTFTDEACVTVCLGCKTSDSSAPGITCFASMTLVFGVILM